jgi:hypothetical protein
VTVPASQRLMGREYIAITVWQPWASLIAIGAKPWEFRRYAAPERYVGQRIAIHAGARPMVLDEVRQLRDRLHRPGRTAYGTGLRPELALDLLEALASSLGRAGPPPLPYSAVVALATLGRPVRGIGLERELGITHDSDRDEHSNFGWPLSEIEEIPGPHPYVRGKQGWWHWQDHRV